MSDPVSLRRRILGGETVVGTFLNLGSPMAAELCGKAGFDWLVLDMEHGALTEAGLLPILHAVEGTPATAVVRVEEGTRLRIGRALDFGAPALMVPRVDSAAHAEQIVRYVRYPPLGTRGVALPTRGAGYGSTTHGDVATAHEETALFIQLESAEAAAAAEDIAAIDGVDVLFVGPTDLTHALGVPGDITAPAYAQAVTAIGHAARDHGKAAGVLLWALDDLAPYRDAGYTVFAVGSDGGYVASAARGLAAAFRERIGEPISG
ncbi:MAG TPA: aldolase/citrate lyase family protein [Candidatus Limnocylindria bacterium]|nr:aldolase/citrate lyase family protein [Candidatus Limnocylindria bacterium]